MEEIVSSAHAEFHVVVFKDVVAVGELGRITLSLEALFLSSLDVGPVVEVNVILALGWSESKIVKSRCYVLSEVSLRSIEQSSPFLMS